MSGEHTHPELDAQIAAVQTGLGQVVGELSNLSTVLSQHEAAIAARVNSLEAAVDNRLDTLEGRVIRYSPVFKLEDRWSLDCDGDEHLLKLGSNDRGEWVPPVSGRLDPACYLNVDTFDLKDPAKPARLMVWMRRKAWNGKPADDTFLYDIWLQREGLVHHDWRAFWERGEAGRPVYWLYKVTGANSVVVDTRYVKYSILT